MGIFKKKIVEKSYDRDHMKPVIRASICTGEQVAGFKDIQTGKLEEIMLTLYLPHQYILHIQVDAFMISWTELFTVLEVMKLSNLNRVLLLQ